MNRNEISRFSQNPSVNIERSVMTRPADYKTTFNAGLLIPFYCDPDILPGDTFNKIPSIVARASSALKHPVMDNAYLDIYFFGVPWRLLWDHSEEFHGATDKAWNVEQNGPEAEYEVPHIPVPVGGFKLGSTADYFGDIPTYTGEGETVNALPFRAYLKVWNDFFRDPNLMDEVMLNTGDDGSLDVDVQKPLPVCKFHDYFTSALPKPQRGDPVTISLFSSDTTPVFTQEDPNAYYTNVTPVGGDALRFRTVGNGAYVSDGAHELYISGSIESERRLYAKSDPIREDSGAIPQVAGKSVLPTNLVADTSLASVTINDLREAFAIQRIFEADARGGTRYTSLIRQHFGVISPDARLQRAEYLGGKRIPLNRAEVVQTGGTLDNSPLGSVGAMMKSKDNFPGMNKSFTEHTIVIGVACVRTDRSYQQGLGKKWSKRKRFDYYLPELAHIGEQPIYNREIYWQNATTEVGARENGEVFGYNEPWADYRYRPSLVSGYFRTNASQNPDLGGALGRTDVDGNPLAGSLDSWHYADYYTELPRLSADWIKEDKSVIDRTLVVTSAVTHQFIFDIWDLEKVTRPMPVHSIPGLGSHI